MSLGGGNGRRRTGEKRTAVPLKDATFVITTGTERKASTERTE